MKIAYTGTADFQEFSAADFEKAGIEEGKKVRFARGEPTEVSDEIGEALTSDEGIFAGHSFTNLDEVEEGETDAETEENQRKAADKAAKKTAKKAAKKADVGGAQTGAGATTQSAGAGTTGTGTPGSTGSTGAGTSTGGTT